jgi:hypothetical protein
MIKRFVGCGGGRLGVREGGEWGGYCINKGKGEKVGYSGLFEILGIFRVRVRVRVRVRDRVRARLIRS